MNLNSFRQLKPGFTVRSPYWKPFEDIIKTIETFEDPGAGGAVATRAIETERGHQIDLLDQGAIAMLRTSTSFPVYDEERQVLNLDREEIMWTDSRDEENPVVIGTLYNWEASEPIIPGYQDYNEARQAVIESMVAQAERWAGRNDYDVRQVNII